MTYSTDRTDVIFQVSICHRLQFHSTACNKVTYVQCDWISINACELSMFCWKIRRSSRRFKDFLPMIYELTEILIRRADFFPSSCISVVGLCRISRRDPEWEVNGDPSVESRSSAAPSVSPRPSSVSWIDIVKQMSIINLTHEKQQQLHVKEVLISRGQEKL